MLTARGLGGCTALHSAVYWRRVDVVRAILKLTSNSQELLTAANAAGSTPLHHAAELGLIETKASKQQRYYESTLVVSLDIEVKSSLLTKIAGSLAKYQTGYGLRSSPFELAAISIAVDNMAFVGPKPTAFSLARQANAPFDSKLFVSTAPLQTDDHLELLHAIEQSWK
ncbi:MAG TPA: ankyrin repeat domain-containing protein [Planctomycetes bacterium]|nr:ankyrin repeat domain-containing protein [Planctomycetota bacterium]